MKKKIEICFPISCPVSLGNVWIGHTKPTPELLEHIRKLNSSWSDKPGNQ